jgi:putative FmdB family regulatory protein
MPVVSEAAGVDSSAIATHSEVCPMTYEYLCTACENVWEAEQSISEAPLKVCPRCKKETAKRQVSGGAGFILKGGGWYSDLYGSAPKKSAEPSSDSPSSGDGKKAAETKKSDATSGETSAGSGAKETSKGSGGSDGGSKGTPSGSGSKGGADSSAA